MGRVMKKKLKAIAKARYYIRIDEVICPVCGNSVHSPEEDWWVCSTKCDYTCWTKDLKFVFKEKSK